MTAQPPTDKPAPDVAWNALLAALDEMQVASQAAHPDRTVQWAINELSDEGRTYLFGPLCKVLDAYKTWKAANSPTEGIG